ncbi:flagellar export chaperone FliS [Anaerosinus sp.]|uniref:flagellar export chaperone FliS n=1 Tax=Selenobaculum sp. TaxID=3074374 RepID=UPI0015B19F80
MQQNAAQTAEYYRRQQILTATPEQLTLMLYNGALKFINEGTKAMKEKNYEESNKKFIRVQNILSELQATLKMEYEISENLNALYDYSKRCLVDGNINDDLEKIEEVKEIITEIRNAWHEAMKIAKKAR